MTQVKQLYALQELDLEAARHTARLQEIAKRLAGNQELEAQRNLCRETQKRLTEARIALKDLELESQKLVSEIQSTERQLYSGNVRNPKELANLEGKLESLRRRRASLEDELLEAMVRADEASEDHQAAERSVQQMEAEWQDTRQNLLEERQGLETRLQELQKHRTEIVAEVHPSNLQLYEALRQRKGGRAVALVQGQVCRECGIAVPTGLVGRAREGVEPTRCSNCDRILFVAE
ncbi:MAG: zinc ribbon domain-containing protein [Anaerolineae bacterium]